MSRSVQVDVRDLGPRQVRLDVGQHAHDAGHGTLDVQLAGADQGHVVEAQPAGGVRRELGGQVAGRGEHDADEVVHGEAVRVHDTRDHLRHALEHVVTRVLLELRRSADRSYPHCSSSPRARPTLATHGHPAGRQSRAASRRAPSSSRVSSRVVPEARPCRRTGPTAVRVSRRTGWPSSSKSRRTTRLRPSWITTSMIARSFTVETTFAAWTSTVPSSSSPPSRGRPPVALAGPPATSATYVFSSSYDG